MKIALHSTRARGRPENSFGRIEKGICGPGQGTRLALAGSEKTPEREFIALAYGRDMKKNGFRYRENERIRSLASLSVRSLSLRASFLRCEEGKEADGMKTEEKLSLDRR